MKPPPVRLVCTPEYALGETEDTVYLCDRSWDGGPFLTYPLRVRKVHLIDHEFRPPELQCDIPFTYTEDANTGARKDRDFLERSSFFQNWFIFGLLAEFCGLNSNLPMRSEVERFLDACVTDGPHRPVINEAGILRYTQLGMKALEEVGDHRGAYVEHMRCCLRLADIVCRQPVAVFDKPTMLLITGLRELLATVIYRLGAIVSPAADGYYGGTYTWGTWVHVMQHFGLRRRMLQNGWCISAIDRLYSDCVSIHMLHYISYIKLDVSGSEHLQCDEHRCIAAQIDMNDYKPLHVKLIEILQKPDQYPVLCLRNPGNEDDFEIVVEPYVSNVPYVALSHVWADGLGNPLHNSLPKCQMRKLSMLLRDLELEQERAAVSTISFDGSARPETTSKKIIYRLWIDTLCCPIDPEGKEITLRRMADIYRNAQHVLVLDSVFGHVRLTDASIVEVMSRVIYSSSWMRRLWCLQEATLASTLYFQFADGQATDFEMMIRVRDLARRDPRYAFMLDCMARETKTLRSFFRRGIPSELASFYPVESVTLHNLQNALYHRSVSVASDEPLCISTLLELDVAYVTETYDGQERMRRVWEMIERKIGGIPSRIVMIEDETITQQGWRWAPRSILKPALNPISEAAERSLRFGEPDSNSAFGLGKTTSFGLKVNFPGSRISSHPLLSRPPFSAGQELFPGLNKFIMARNEDASEFYYIRLRKTLQKEQDNSLKIEDNELWEFTRQMREDLICHEYAAIKDDRNIRLMESDPHYYRLVKVLHECENDEQETGTSPVLKVRLCSPIAITPCGSESKDLYKAMYNIAQRIWIDSIAPGVRLPRYVPSAGILAEAHAGMTHRTLEKAVDSMLSAEPEIRSMLQASFEVRREDIWRVLLSVWPSDIIITDLPEDQVWYVD